MQTCLLVGHPGHELVVHGWASRHRPRVYVVTDGSGSAQQSRLGSSRRVLDGLGLEAGNCFGVMTDRQAYEAILSGDEAPFVELVHKVASELVVRELGVLASDAFEGYNPVHDLVRVLADATARVLMRWTGRPIQRLEIDLADPPLPRPAGEQPVVVELTDAEWEHKRRAAENYPELAREFELMLATRGVGGLRRECLHPIVSERPLPRFEGGARYEHFGEERVRSGAYGTVLRLDTHFLPLVARIDARLERLSPPRERTP
jgi:hypothetical protein